jgi:hypothetical protein
MGLGSIICEQTTEPSIICYTFHQQRHLYRQKITVDHQRASGVTDMGQLNGPIHTFLEK